MASIGVGKTLYGAPLDSDGVLPHPAVRIPPY